MKIILLLFFICFQTILLSQTVPPQSDTVTSSSKKRPLSVFNGTQSIATSYTNTACGLNYLQVSHPLFARTGNNFTLSVLQPATFSVSGLPACAVIEKAFLYVGTEGNGVNINASVTNPGSGNSIFPMTIVGTGPDKGWGFPSSYTYRADITSIMDGNGSYVISGIPTSTSTTGNDANGATMLIVYSDRTQNYTGSIVIADGSMGNMTAGTATATLNGFNVCGTPLLTSSFILVDDLQQYGTSNLFFNSASSNFVLPPSLDTPWDFITGAGTPAVSNQSTAVYGISNTADTVGLLVAGLYYRTNCLSCPSTLSLVAVSTPSCLASATVNVTGGVGPYTYTWTSSTQSTAIVSNLSAGIQTVTVSDQLNCLKSSVTFTVSTPAPTITVSSPTFVCIGFSNTLTAGPILSYTWSPAASISNPNAQTVTVSPTATTIYTVAYTNTLGCTNSDTVRVTVTLTQNFAINNATVCTGQTLNLSSNSFPGSGYTWTGPVGYVSLSPNPIITNATVGQSGAYNLSVTSVPGCTSMAVSNVTVFPVPTPTVTNNSPICAKFNLNLGSSGGTSYSWKGPNGFTSLVQNPTIVNSSSLATGIYTLTAFFNTGCSQSITQSVTVWALPPTTCAVTSTNVCIGRDINFGSSGGGTYSWVGPAAFTSTLQNPSISNISLATNGIYTVTATDSHGCKASATADLAAIANPAVSASGTVVCFGSPATMTANGVGFYAWYGPNGYYHNVPLDTTIFYDTIPVVDNFSAGVYTVVLLSASSTCTAQATATIGTIPVPIPVTSSTDVCLYAPGTLTATGGIGYDWTGPNNYTGTGSNPVVPVADTLTAGIYTVVCMAANSCSTAATATLGILPLPTVTATGTLICLNEPFTILANGAITYTWTGPSLYTALGANAYVPSVNPLTIGNYTVVGTAPNTCTQVTTANLMTMPLPTITTLGDVVCLNEPAILVAMGGLADSSGYTWTGPFGYASGQEIASIVSATNVPVATFTVVGTAPNTCTQSATANLVTIPLPTVVATSSVVCFRYPYTLVATGAAAYTWTGPPTFTGKTVQNLFIPVVDSAAVGIYTVLGQGLNTCTQVATATLAVMSLPHITSSDTTVCLLKSAILHADGGVPTGYTWTGPQFLSFYQDAFIPAATSAATQTYLVVGTAPNSCTSSATSSLSTYALPQPYYTAPSRVCFGSSVTVEGFGALTYTWTGPYSQIYPEKKVTFPIFNIAQGGFYTLSVLDSNNCGKDTSTYIKVDPLPEGQLVSNNTNKSCAPYCSTFGFMSSDAVPIISTNWVVNGAPINSNTFYYCASIAGATAVTGSFVDSLGCANTTTFAVVAYPVPVANFEFAPDVPRENIDVVHFTNTSSGENQVLWNWSLVDNAGFQSAVKNLDYVFDTSGVFGVAMIVENVWGCRDTLVKTIMVDNDFEIFVPNIFTPNGDGLNDVFQPKGRGITGYSFIVYDRWGILLFQTNEFDKGWDGTFKGAACDDNSYTWKIKALGDDGQYKNLNGSVILAK